MISAEGRQERTPSVSCSGVSLPCANWIQHCDNAKMGGDNDTCICIHMYGTRTDLCVSE